jgi:membrane protein YdbS with pleckstrin-like domain
MSTPSAGPTGAAPPLTLHEPAHQVSPRAVPYWRLSAIVVLLTRGAFLLAAILSTYTIGGLGGVRPWVIAVCGILLAALLARVVWMPPLRYRIHRWEVTPTAIHTRSGWVTREERIAPLSRVQTVDSRQGALMRFFNLSTITVTTASAAGPIEIECLDEAVARRVVAELTEIVGQTTGDAT